MREHRALSMSKKKSSNNKSRELVGSRGFPWAGVFGIFIVAAISPVLGVTGYAYYKSTFEISPPQVQFASIPGAISEVSPPLVVTMTDSDSGLQALRVEIVQGSTSSELMTKVFEEGVHDFELTIPLKFDGSRVREGPLRVLITAWDRSRWSNYGQVQADLYVDVTPPEIQLLSGEAKLEQAGAGFLFFQATDFGGVETGVTVGSAKYAGFRASDLDPSFKGAGDNTYFVFFPVPLDFSNGRGKLKIFAKDMGGNLIEVEPPFSLAGLATESSKIQLSSDNLKSKAIVLGVDSGIDLKGAKLGPEMSVEFASQIMRQSLWLLSRDHEQKFGKLGVKSTLRRLWNDAFTFNYPKKIVAAHFGDEIEWLSGGVSLGRTRSTGLMVNLEKSEVVKAGNAGVVAFVGDAGQFGRMVVIDHGFGLTTSYCFLSQTHVNQSSKIRGGDILGNAGSTGLGPEDGALIEVRLHGSPIDPLYWTDQNWIKTHIDRVILGAKSKLGM